jgi:hypothetical protein
LYPRLPSRPGDLHPEALKDPDVNLSIHPRKVKIFDAVETPGYYGHSICKRALGRGYWRISLINQKLLLKNAYLAGVHRWA